MSDKRGERIFRSDSFWQVELDKFNASGLRISEYCRRNGLAESTFSRKRQELMGTVAVRRKNRSMICPEQLPDSTAGVSGSGFIEIKPAALFVSEPLRIILPTNIVLEVPATYNPEQLVQVLALCRAGS